MHYDQCRHPLDGHSDRWTNTALACSMYRFGCITIMWQDKLTSAPSMWVNYVPGLGLYIVQRSDGRVALSCYRWLHIVCSSSSSSSCVDRRSFPSLRWGKRNPIFVNKWSIDNCLVVTHTLVTFGDTDSFKTKKSNALKCNRQTAMTIRGRVKGTDEKCRTFFGNGI